MCDTHEFIIDNDVRNDFMVQFTDYIRVLFGVLLISDTVERFEELMTDVAKDVSETFEKDTHDNPNYVFTDNAIATQAVIDISYFLTPLIASFFKYDSVQITEAALLDMYDNLMNA